YCPRNSRSPREIRSGRPAVQPQFEDRLDALWNSRPCAANLGFRFEIQGGHVVQNQRQSTAVRSVGEALLGDRVAVTAGVDLAGMGVDGLVGLQPSPKICQHS